MTDNTLIQTIATQINDHDVILYMKGSKKFPMCGFSGTVVQILESLDVNFHDVDVLEDDNIRQAIKDYSNWPTIPQLYVKQEFIGGCDIIREMFETGELATLLQEKALIA